MLTIKGGKKCGNTMNGGSLHSLSPADFDGLATLPNVGPNYRHVPTIPGSSTQVGGGYSYGYNGGKDVSTFGGNYAPYSSSNTGSEFDTSRGGNNFMSGGAKRRRRRTAKKTKWLQIGCNKKKGGKGKRSSGKRSSTKRKRSSSKRK
jgi:hypothetical protein